jgi:hypothetical protein
MYALNLRPLFGRQPDIRAVLLIALTLISKEFLVPPRKSVIVDLVKHRLEQTGLVLSNQR